MESQRVALARQKISREEFAQWKSDSVTKKIIARMDLTVEHLKQQWYESKYRESSSEDGIVTKDEEAFWRGFANGIHEFLRIELVLEDPQQPNENERG